MTLDFLLCCALPLVVINLKSLLQPTADQVRYAQLLNQDEPDWLKQKIQEVCNGRYIMCTYLNCMWALTVCYSNGGHMAMYINTMVKRLHMCELLFELLQGLREIIPLGAFM